MRNLAVLAAAAALLAACSPPQVSQDGKTVTMKTPTGQTVTAGECVQPTNLPSYLKVYPGAKVTAGVDSGPAGGLLSLETSDSPDKVIAWYKKLAEDAGLTAHNAAQSGGTGSSGQAAYVFAQETGGKNFTLTTQVENGKTTVAIVYGPQG